MKKLTHKSFFLQKNRNYKKTSFGVGTLALKIFKPCTDKYLLCMQFCKGLAAKYAFQARLSFYNSYFYFSK